MASVRPCAALTAVRFALSVSLACFLCVCSAFDSARRNGDVSFIKVSIVNDRLECVHTERRGSSGGGWSRDYDAMAKQLDDDVPAFFIFWKARDDVS